MGWFNKGKNRPMTAPESNYDNFEQTTNHEPRHHQTAPKYHNQPAWNEDIEMKHEITKSTQITTFQPTTYDDVDEIANHLMKFKQIKLNLTSMNIENRLRTIDFISGVMYAYHGKVEVIGHHQYLFII